tara:strand:+ start:183 stop:311 length:129 start_codon:yes stop_codon:yes gene_type:complete
MFRGGALATPRAEKRNACAGGVGEDGVLIAPTTGENETLELA